MGRKEYSIVKLNMILAFDNKTSMGTSDMYCMSDDYLVQELIDEQKSNKINQ
ncbi:hypothetical protein [Ruminococcus bromii]|uniref:hypothetical protein n=1 Tax=Ruminococcus bromii TaxID=40518 RepID=UPI0020179D2E|nr:hypothetical protein [Ruminococcus bromii]